ncbi:hypothetical protein EDEG_01829 [Edhazardia aedis USNM 41457]|uniref:Uncharacterized protein n=1 Tax=Edhazardia aedis (strain USNM 41457) TaxID=1003232 RepID=J9D7V1_EDHAE|nr:hypothetical protein EDEG_01829 [Edhazardia aedis USNM 41457]|eukprot:EJW03876.1 hypothetical protein EDEG_01829 [Edhazardia aedis USNM 41457]
MASKSTRTQKTVRIKTKNKLMNKGNSSKINEIIDNQTFLISKHDEITHKIEKYHINSESFNINNEISYNNSENSSKEIFRKKKPRIVSDEILKNKGYKFQKRNAYNNPKVNNRRKAEKLFEQAKFKENKNIKTNLTRTHFFKQ